MSEKVTGRIVYSTLDLNDPPPLTEQQRAEMDRLRLMRDEDIDFSDIPPQTGPWRRVAGSGSPLDLLRQKEWGGSQLRTCRIAPDVLEFFRKRGDDSDERINDALREYAELPRKSA